MAEKMEILVEKRRRGARSNQKLLSDLIQDTKDSIED